MIMIFWRRLMQKICICYLVILSVLGFQNPALTLIVPKLSDEIGINIHFIKPQAGEVEMLANSGVRWVRMDLFWNETEREKGVYNFSDYDQLISVLEKYKIHPVFILGYTNKLYDQGMSPYTDEAQKAFTAWATAAVKRFKNKKIIWEIYNEPNLDIFWQPKSDVNPFAKLAISVGEAIRKIDPDAVYIGPATSSIDLTFLENCFKLGLLRYWSAVSVHPYRTTIPETVTDEYTNLKRLIAKYAPPGKTIPIISGEWGYSTSQNGTWKVDNEKQQAVFLVRKLLTNITNGISLSIWYDWRDYGTDPSYEINHFGIVRHAHFPNRVPVFEPKESYKAMVTLNRNLGIYSFQERLKTENPDDYILLFKKKRQIRYIIWTTSKIPHKIQILASPSVREFQIESLNGVKLDVIKTTSNKVEIEVTDSPKYLMPI
jgi:polysaccharide biosynthesis protein PslG